MVNKIKKVVDKPFFITILLLVIFGIFIFFSASLGLLEKNPKAFNGVLLNQLVLGLPLGVLGAFIFYKIDYKLFRDFAFYIFLGTICITLLTFIPSLGVEHKGATRWLDLGPISLQPVEFLKFGFILYFSAWLSWVKHKVSDFKFGFLPLFIIMIIIGVILAMQPDTKSMILIFTTGLLMFFLSGGKIKFIFILGGITILGLAFLVFTRPYLQERIKTYFNPSSDLQGSGYQLKQSTIAVGVGGLFGRGYGQSVQKFTYLPEAQGDSVFAVIGEEFGFFGSVFVIFLFTFFFLRGMKIANKAPDLFSRLLVSGVVIMIITQSFLHIASVLGVFPLTGVPLPFMSHGGTSLMIYLWAMGLILQISKYQVTNFNN